jgi:hypothetical protein
MLRKIYTIKGFANAAAFEEIIVIATPRCGTTTRALMMAGRKNFV